VQGFADYREMIACAAPDLVVVVTPTATHFEVASFALEHGCHTLIEKPIARALDEALALVELSREQGVILAVGHVERFNPAVRRLKQLLEEGTLGTIYQLHARRLGPFPPRIRDVGVTLDLATHDLDVMGSGPAQASLEALARVEGVSDRVRILPPAPYEELLQWTASAELGLIAYRGDYSLNVRYCLPNKLFEYLMAGVPVVATELDAVADILRRYDVGVVIPSTEPEVVGKAISAILADIPGRARMRGNALVASQGELRWEMERERLETLYESVAGPVLARVGERRSSARGERS
jgi:glycosyltransferase involved in cell wall biosynthesis